MGYLGLKPKLHAYPEEVGDEPRAVFALPRCRSALPKSADFAKGFGIAAEKTDNPDCTPEAAAQILVHDGLDPIDLVPPEMVEANVKADRCGHYPPNEMEPGP